MCGLVALRALAPGLDLRAEAQRALDTLVRRGPDAQGLHVADAGACPTVLGHRRLSILDLQHAADQPMRCPRSGDVLVFNGEIYNFLELRETLQAAGYGFVTDSDTEVLLAGWHAWGEGVFARCNGMWAAVILEQASGDLVFCRDRLGVKPLYLYQDARRLVLASEIRAIAAVLGGHPPHNRAALFDFLVAGLSEHGSETFYDGIRALPPGHVGRVSRCGSHRHHPYHRWPEAGERPPLDAERVRQLLADATALRLRADVPSVSLLSGGLDSSILTHLSLQAGALPHTRYAGAFTYGYLDARNAAYDEVDAAAAFMASRGEQARHHVLRVRAQPTATELAELVAAQEQPFPTPSILASFRMYRAIREAGYKVALCGEGADELFGGYIRLYLALQARDALHRGRLPTVAGSLLRGSVGAGQLLNRLAWDLPCRVLAPLLRRWRPSVGLISAALWHEQHPRLQQLQADRRGSIEARLRADVLSTNLPVILRMTDRNSMHASVEVRSPFLDYRLVEHALASPAATRMGQHQGKALLRQAYAGVLPDALVWQRKSTGFGHAEQFIVDQMPLAELLADLPAVLGDYVDVGRLRQALARKTSHTTLWLALSVALWVRSQHV